MKSKVFIGLGSNIGNREKYIHDAIKHISQIPDTKIIKMSDIYETEPVGNTEQDRFLNMAVCIATRLEPLELLGRLQYIENLLGRKRTIRWGPRTIDLDILLFDDLHLELPQLVIPHPRMFERAFVLIPLSEILDGKDIMGMNVDELINRCSDKDGVKYYGSLHNVIER
ncbi:MAG TPA: 2-amino-4-hydroxy-6-hydroxymethyldihydropteridine diphosphokinase [Clostridiaceae bacterium]|nr:2-amino-4-hydroxy-6-hydroxymethyldihydropteridine diphosphokinase [Clostridiaceae bacterium]